MKTLIIQPLAGLANRLRAIVSAKILAETLQRELLVVWKPQKHTCQCEAEDLFENLPTVNPELFSSEDIRYYDGVSPVDIQNLEAHNTSSQILYIRTCGFFRPTNMSQSEYLLTFQEELQKLRPLREIEAQIVRHVSDMIGLQIRRGDHWQGTKYSPLSLFCQTIERHLKEDPATHFFLCSDSYSVKTYLKKRYGDSIFFYSRFDMGRNSVTGMKTALIDLLTLSRTKLMYSSYNSSFGTLARRFHNTPVINLSLIRLATPLWKKSIRKKLKPQTLCWDAQSEHWKIQQDYRGACSMRRGSAIMQLLVRRFWYSTLYQCYISKFLPQHSLLVRMKRYLLQYS